MATLPPWLDVTPQTYLGAAEAGGRFGEEAANRQEQFREFNENLGIKREEMAQDFAIKAQQMAMDQQNQKIKLATFMNDLKQQNFSNQLALDKHISDKNIDEQKLAVDKHFKEAQMDWRNQQVGLQQQKLTEQSQLAARKYAVEQEAKQRLSNGENPARVMMELGPELHLSGSSLVNFIKDLMPKPEMQQPRVQEYGGENFIVHYNEKGVPMFTHIPTGKTGVLDAHMKTLLTAEKQAAADPEALVEGSDSNKRLKAIRAQLDQSLGISLSQGQATLPAGTQGTALPKVFNFNIQPVQGGAQGSAALGTNIPMPAHTEEGEAAPAPAPAPTEQEGPTFTPTTQPAPQPEAKLDNPVAAEWFVREAKRLHGTDAPFVQRKLADIMAERMGLRPDSEILAVRMRQGADPLYHKSPGRAVNEALAGKPTGNITRDFVTRWMNTLSPEEQMEMYREALGLDETQSEK